MSDVHNIYCEGHNRTNAHLYEICYALGAINQRINRACQPTRHSTHSITSKSYVIIRAEQRNEMEWNEIHSLTPFKPFQSYRMNFLPKNHPSNSLPLSLSLSLVNLIRSIPIFTNEMSFSYNIFSSKLPFYSLLSFFWCVCDDDEQK